MKGHRMYLHAISYSFFSLLSLSIIFELSVLFCRAMQIIMSLISQSALGLRKKSYRAREMREEASSRARKNGERSLDE